MRINLLKSRYKNDEEFYKAFKEDTLEESGFISDRSVFIPNEIPDFKLDFNGKTLEQRMEEYVPVIDIMDKYVITLERDIFMDECFWHSLFCIYRRELYIDMYPEIMESYSRFKKIMLKPFDWANFIYRIILIAQYVSEERPNEKEKYYRAILDNLDLCNYVLKYEVFRNGHFLMNIMDIIMDNDLSALLKSRIKNRPDIGKDERYGRRVMQEFNNSYPMIMSPMLDKETLEKYFMQFLSYYAELNDDELEQNALPEKDNELHEDKEHIEKTAPVEVEKASTRKSMDEKSYSKYKKDELDKFSNYLRQKGYLENAIDKYIKRSDDIDEYCKTNYSVYYLEPLDKEFFTEMYKDLLSKFKDNNSQTFINKYFIYRINQYK